MNNERHVQESEDRLAIRELIDRYAHCADTRDAKSQMGLFTQDTKFMIYYDPKSDTPSQVVNGRDGLDQVFHDALSPFKATMHFNGQATIKLDGDKATGIVYCMAHHQNLTEDGKQTFMIAAIRYHDVYAKQNGKWLFAERKLLVDWIENR